MLKRIVIFEPCGGGHQLYHVRMIIDAAQTAGLRLTFATTEEALADGSAEPLRSILQTGKTELLITRPKLGGYASARKLHPVLQQQFVQTEALRAALRSGGGRGAYGHVFVPFFDAYMTCPLALRMNPCLGIPMSGILHRTRFHMPAMGIRTTIPFHVKVEKYVYASMLRRSDIKLLFTMDPYLDRFYGSDRVKFLPDPGAHAPGRTREAVRAELGVAPGQLAILVHGALDSRKAIDPLLRAVRSLPDPGRVCVVLAGRQDQSVRDTLALPLAQELRSAGHLREITGYLADQVVDDLLQASDICWICYLNSDGNSGVLMKAGQAARPIIAANTGISARLVEDDHIGWQANPADPSSIAATIETILADPAAREAAGVAIHRRFETHTVENFVTPIVQHFQRMRHPPQDFA